MLSKCVFDSIEELSEYFGTEINLPNNIPEDCNVVCFRVSFKEGVKFFQAYKENEQGFFSLEWGGNWEKSSKSLEDELEFDNRLSNDRYIYLRLATKDNSDVFTPERLLGVETDKGFVEGIASVDSNIYLITEGHIISASRCKFYISDDSDETVSFEEYVRIFYEE